jgi:eukaryotic-like serine/threonine-protein kinase
MPYIVFKDSRSCEIPESFSDSLGEIYYLEEQIGSGGNGTVHHCQDKSGKSFAVKFLNPFSSASEKKRYRLELDLMKAISAENNQNLIKLFGEGVVSGKNKKSYVDLTFLIMEKADFNLREFILKSSNNVLEPVYLAQFRGLVSALTTLHKTAIHRDIKPENILVVGERWVISDFGLCSSVSEVSEDITPQGKVIGPRFWLSPEAINKSVGVLEDITFASDIYQLAAVFWWVVNRKHPTGILSHEDWTGHKKTLCDPILKSLQHSQKRRYTNAEDFQLAINSAIEAN